MTFHTWSRGLLAAAGAGVLAGAGQLGIAYGLGLARIGRTFDASARSEWAAQLVWVGWCAMLATVVGAVLAAHVAGRRGFRSTTGSRVALAAAAGVGALVVAPLSMQPARVAEVASVDPVGAAGTAALLGVLVGMLASVAALLFRPVLWNVAAIAGAVWLLALLSVIPSLGTVDQLPSVRVGVPDLTWFSTGTTQRLAVVTMPALALVAGAVIGALIRRDGQPSPLVATAGVGGPAMLALAYLVAGPAGAVDRYQAAPYWGALIAVGAGALGSVLAALTRWPLTSTGTTGADDPATATAEDQPSASTAATPSTDPYPFPATTPYPATDTTSSADTASFTAPYPATPSTPASSPFTATPSYPATSPFTATPSYPATPSSPFTAMPSFTASASERRGELPPYGAAEVGQSSAGDNQSPLGGPTEARADAGNPVTRREDSWPFANRTFTDRPADTVPGIPAPRTSAEGVQPSSPAAPDLWSPSGDWPSGPGQRASSYPLSDLGQSTAGRQAPTDPDPGSMRNSPGHDPGSSDDALGTGLSGRSGNPTDRETSTASSGGWTEPWRPRTEDFWPTTIPAQAAESSPVPAPSPATRPPAAPVPVAPAPKPPSAITAPPTAPTAVTPPPTAPAPITPPLPRTAPPVVPGPEGAYPAARPTPAGDPTPVETSTPVDKSTPVNEPTPAAVSTPAREPGADREPMAAVTPTPATEPTPAAAFTPAIEFTLATEPMAAVRPTPARKPTAASEPTATFEPTTFEPVAAAKPTVGQPASADSSAPDRSAPAEPSVPARPSPAEPSAPDRPAPVGSSAPDRPAPVGSSAPDRPAQGVGEPSVRQTRHDQPAMIVPSDGWNAFAPVSRPRPAPDDAVTRVDRPVVDPVTTGVDPTGTSQGHETRTGLARPFGSWEGDGGSGGARFGTDQPGGGSGWTGTTDDAATRGSRSADPEQSTARATTPIGARQPARVTPPTDFAAPSGVAAPPDFTTAAGTSTPAQDVPPAEGTPSTESSEPADSASSTGVTRRIRRGLFRRNRSGSSKGSEKTDDADAGSAEPRQRESKGRGRTDEPLPAKDEEYVDWVSGLSEPDPDADDLGAEPGVRRSLRSTGRHHAD